MRMSRFNIRLTLALAAASMAVTAPAQTVTQLGNYRDAAGQIMHATGTTILNPDGTTASFSSGAAAPTVTRGALTDGSGTVTTGGTSQQVFASLTTRSYLMCQNPTSATETLFVNIGVAASTAGGSIELAPGSSITFSNNFIPTGTVNLTAATAAHRYLCKQG
jgi:hypothetical protein